VRLNRQHIQETGGTYCPPENVRNVGSLSWVLDAIQYRLFGEDQYPRIEQKAALLAWVIIDGHVFYDGCKRTGMSAMEVFLHENGARLLATNDEVVEIALELARGPHGGGCSFDDFVVWLESRIGIPD